MDLIIIDPVTADDVVLEADPAGTLHVRARPNLATGVLACHVTSSKVNGTFSLEPAFDLDDLDPATTRLTVHYGGELPPGAVFGRQRLRRPVVHRTVRLVDATVIDAARARDGARTPRELGLGVIWRRDVCTRHRTAPVPRRVAQCVAAVVAALARYWLDRPDVDQLRCAAACRSIRRYRLLQRQHQAITQHETALAELRRRFARMQQLLAREPEQQVGTPPGIG
ncbi:MAG TPA: hypothetical protein VFV66_02255 [Nonomuraea sp.]|nr:hypothetical protein [Nonomuraea sp.]